MNGWRPWLARIGGTFRARRRDRDLEEELRFHLEERIERNVAHGMSREEARTAALRAFGGLEQIKERARDQKGMPALDHLLKDVRFAARSLRKQAGFSFAIILILAVGIGANATVYGWLKPFLFDPLPGAANQKSLVAIESRTQSGHAAGEPLSTSFLDFRDYRDYLKQMDVVGIGRGALAVASGPGAAADTWCELVSGNFFDVLGLRPAAGRFFLPSEQTDQQNASPVVVIGYDYWRAHFHFDPAAIGSTLFINRVPFTVIGVAPERFNGTQTGLRYDLWLPLSMYGTVTHTGTWMLQDRSTRNFTMLGRLKPGVTLPQAQSEAEAFARRMERANWEDAGVGVAVLPVSRWHFGPQATLLWPMTILMAACLLLLLIAGANVASLQLARAATRQKEFSIRLALGSSRARLARLLLIESILLSLVAAVLALIVARWLGDALVWLLPAVANPSLTLSSVAGGIFGFAFALAMAVAALSGGAPAVFAARSDLNEMLSQGGRSGSARVPSLRLRGSLVVAEVALAVVTLVVASAFLKSLENLRSARLGFDPSGQVIAQFDLTTAGYSQAQASQFCERMSDQVRALPGVTGVSYADTVPLGFRGGNWEQLEIEGYHPSPGENMKIYRNLVGPGYFDVMKIPRIAGRDFNLGDGPASTPVMIVTDEFVHRFIPRGSVIGRKVHGWGRWFSIVGVVGSIDLERGAAHRPPFFYIPIRQQYRPEYGLAFHIRTSGSADALIDEVRTTANRIDPSLPLFDAQPLGEYIGGSLYGLKIAATLLSVLAGIGVALAAMGLYCVTAFSVAKRSGEFGIRIALGAQAKDLFTLVLREGLGFAAIGWGVGTVLAAIGVRWLALGATTVQPVDLRSYGAAVLVTAVAATAALIVPARRTLKIDPLAALRAD